MKETENYSFKKPDVKEFFELQTWSDNLDKIDQEIKNRELAQNESNEQIGKMKKISFDEQEEPEELKNGETVKSAFGKLAVAVKTLIIHKTLQATDAVLGHVKLSNSAAITEKGLYALDAVEKNATVDGTMAKKISELNDGLEKHSHTWDSITGKPSAFPPSSSDLLNKIYPVGSIYMSINNVSPQTFIGGTWEQIKNRWLVGAGDEYAVGTYGGNAVHSHTQRMIFTANYAGNNGLMYTAGGTTPTDVIYTGETRSVPPYYAVYMWKRIA